jgi:hypothetical protein
MRNLIAVMGAVLLIGSSCSEPRRDYRSSLPPQPATRVELTGRWIDLDDAVAMACEANDLAVVEAERWATVVRFQIVSDVGREGTLVVVGVPEAAPVAGSMSKNDDDAVADELRDTPDFPIRFGEIRLGSFRDPAREAEFMRSLRRALRDLQSKPRLTGSK